MRTIRWLQEICLCWKINIFNGVLKSPQISDKIAKHQNPKIKGFFFIITTYWCTFVSTFFSLNQYFVVQPDALNFWFGYIKIYLNVYYIIYYCKFTAVPNLSYVLTLFWPLEKQFSLEQRQQLFLREFKLKGNQPKHQADI